MIGPLLTTTRKAIRGSLDDVKDQTLEYRRLFGLMSMLYPRWSAGRFPKDIWWIKDGGIQPSILPGRNGHRPAMRHVFPNRTTSRQQKRSVCSDTQRDLVKIPDLFVSWASQRPRVNPFYEKVQPDFERWFREYVSQAVLPSVSERKLMKKPQFRAGTTDCCLLSHGNLDDINCQKLIKADLPYFAAAWAPDADEDAYRLACDWVGWVSTHHS